MEVEIVNDNADRILDNVELERTADTFVGTHRKEDSESNPDTASKPGFLIVKDGHDPRESVRGASYSGLNYRRAAHGTSRAQL